MLQYDLDELKSAAISLAHELAQQPSQAVRSTTEVLVNSSDRELEELLIEERQVVKDNNGTKDYQKICWLFYKRENHYSINKVFF